MSGYFKFFWRRKGHLFLRIEKRRLLVMPTARVQKWEKWTEANLKFLKHFWEDVWYKFLIIQIVVLLIGFAVLNKTIATIALVLLAVFAVLSFLAVKVNSIQRNNRRVIREELRRRNIY